MNFTQKQTTVAPMVAFLAGLLAGKGVFGLDVNAWTQVIGAAAAFGATLWGAFAATKNQLINTVANEDDVKSITLNASASTGLVNSTPNNVNK